MIKSLLCFSFCISALGCVSGGMHKVDTDASIEKDVVVEIVNAWNAQKSLRLKSIHLLPEVKCPQLVSEYKKYDVCVGAYLVASEYEKNIGYSAFHSYRLCTKTECAIVFGETNYGIEE